MLKKLMLVFGLMLALSAAPIAMAQMPANEAEALAAFAKEGPLTQKDIDNYLKVLPKAQEMSADQTKAAAILKDAGFTEIRGAYVGAKVGIAMMMAQLGDQADAMLAQQQVPDVLKPSKEEVDLVGKNLDKIQKAVMGQ